MERLYAPWRRTFVESSGGSDTGCFLCAAPQRDDDAETLILYRGARVYVIMNLYPYNSGHLLIAPYAHGGDFPALPAETATELIQVAQRCVRALDDEYAPRGHNLGMNIGNVAGAGVPDHAHIHVVPRWPGDANFMPIVGETKVLSETLAQSYARLLPHFRTDQANGGVA
jgi:ATP adenylyltransferase